MRDEETEAAETYATAMVPMTKSMPAMRYALWLMVKNAWSAGYHSRNDEVRELQKRIEIVANFLKSKDMHHLSAVMNSRLKPASLQLTSSRVASRYHRLHDGSPGSDYSGRDSVSVARETTRDAEERSLVGTIGFVDTAAGGTGPTSVARVYVDHGHACQPGLVLDKAAELVEAPVSQSCPLAAPGRNPRANTPEVFEGDATRGAFSRLHDGLRDAVVRVPLKAGLLALNLTELAPCRPGALPLEVAPAVGEDAAVLLDFGSRVDVAVRVGGDVDDAEVHAEELLGLGQGRLFHLADDVEVEAAAVVDEVHLTLAVGQEAPLVVTTDERNELPTLEGPEGHGVLGLETEDTVVVGDGAERAEGALGLAVEFVGIGHLGDAADHHLSAEGEFGLERTVDELLERELVEGAGLPGSITCVVAGSVGPLHRLPKERDLLGTGLELEIDRQLHRLIVQHSSVERKYARKEASPSGWAALPPRSKETGLPRRTCL